MSLQDLMVKELTLSLEDNDIRKLSVRTDPTNEDLTRVMQKIFTLDHLEKLLEVLRTRLAIEQGLTVNNITTGPNQYRFKRTFLDGKALSIFDLMSTELCHKTVADLILVMDHVVIYFVPKECPYKQKRYIRYKIENPASSPQGSMWDWFAISIQGWHRCHRCLTKTKIWMNPN